MACVCKGCKPFFALNHGTIMICLILPPDGQQLYDNTKLTYIIIKKTNKMYRR